jgi:hypothetical protein
MHVSFCACSAGFAHMTEYMKKVEQIGLNGAVMANDDTNTARIDGDFR